MSIALAGVMAISMNIVSFAAEGTQSNYDRVTLEEIEEKYQITEDEMIHLDENIKSALVKANNTRTIIQEGENSEQVIPISENLRLVISTQAEANNAKRTIYETTITSTLEIENIVGATIVTLNSVGVFDRDGSTCVPVDAYGTYDTFVWTVTDVESKLSDSGYSSWVRNSFDVECNIGIDPVSMTISSFSYACKITCNAKGIYNITWV